jgi:hypothetical protein
MNIQIYIHYKERQGKMKKIIFTASLLAVATMALSGCGDKQPDCNSEEFSNAVVEQVGGSFFTQYNNPAYQFIDYKFTDKQDYIKRNHIELRNIKEISADEKSQTKVCSFDISMQPVGPTSVRGEIKNQSLTVSINNEGKQVPIMPSDYGYGMLRSMKRVELNKPSKEQTEEIEKYNKKMEAEKKEKEAFKAKILSVPLDKYQFISSEDMTLLYLSRAEKMDDKEMLNLVSAAYYNEHDEFAKRDLEKTLIPELYAKLRKYKEVKYIKFISSYAGVNRMQTTFTPISGKKVLDIRDGSAFPDKYDFNKQQYSLIMGGCPTANLFKAFIRNSQNIRLVMHKDESLASCVFKPKDETEARAWNDVFKKEQYSLKHDNYATIYVALKDKLNDNNRLDGTLVRVDVDYNTDTPLHLKAE